MLLLHSFMHNFAYVSLHLLLLKRPMDSVTSPNRSQCVRQAVTPYTTRILFTLILYETSLLWLIQYLPT